MMMIRTLPKRGLGLLALILTTTILLATLAWSGAWSTTLTRLSPPLLVALGFGAAAIGAALTAWLLGRRQQRALATLATALDEVATQGEVSTDLDGLRDQTLDTNLHESLDRLALAVRRDREELERSYIEAVAAVVLAIDARDNETTGHSFRVARYAVALGDWMGLDAAELRILEWGSLLHDIGKIAVPDAILRKAGPLSQEEWHIMRQHPSWGAEILAGVTFLQTALPIVFHHQERWDGEGYPLGIQRHEIPLGARIFAVVDTYDAITSDRPYRQGRSHDAALEELRRVAGSQLDPGIVEVFQKIPEVELRRLRRLGEQRASGHAAVDGLETLSV